MLARYVLQLWFTLHSVFENGESLYIVLGVVFCYNTSRTIPPACSAACNMGASDITPATKRAVHEAYAAALDVDAKSIAVDVVENEKVKNEIEKVEKVEVGLDCSLSPIPAEPEAPSTGSEQGGTPVE